MSEPLFSPTCSRRDFLRRTAMGCACAGAFLLGTSGKLLAQNPGTPTTGFMRPRTARYWKAEGKTVHCELCPNFCVVSPGERGICEVRENQDGTYKTLVYGNPTAVHVDPIEKKPFFHFLPGTLSYSIATAGCNFDCKFCQNFEISQARPENTYNFDLPPDKLVRDAVASGAKTAAYTYVEPTIFFEYMVDCCAAVRDAGLKNVIHSNGYINPAPLAELLKVMDAFNFDFKGPDDAYYKSMSNGALPPVLRTYESVHAAGKHLELTTLVVPGYNDGPDTLRKMADWIVAHLGPDIPWHISRFYPRYKLANLPQTAPSTLIRAAEIGKAAGLRYVYVGNLAESGWEHTDCPKCKRVLVERNGFTVRANRIVAGKCPDCGERVYGGW